MMFYYYLLFLIPIMFLCNSWYIYQCFIIVLMLKLLLFNVGFMYCSVSYIYGMDYISLGLISLTLLIISLMILASNLILNLNYNYFIFIILILCLILIYIFSVLNMLLMYIFFELSLIPLLILIFGWGYQPERLISGLYLFFYTLFASLPLFLIIIYLYSMCSSLSLMFLQSNLLSFFFNFSLVFAFLVKLPMFLVHLWLPKAHVQAPVSGSMILAGVLLKIGGYGIIRVVFINELVFMKMSWIWYSISIMGCFLVSLICFIQGDVKCMIAYSSVVHMGLCLMGLLTMSNWGLFGGYLMMIGHGLCSSGLFCLANILYDRLLSRSFFINKGMMVFMPSMSVLWFMFCCLNMSCPPSINFLSEVIVFCSMLSYCWFSFLYIIFISFISACFSFYLFSYSQHGMMTNYYCSSPGMVREFLLLYVHMIPLFLIILSFSNFI
nr:NADH dehydrogenase subunit 4 [Ujna puerana]